MSGRRRLRRRTIPRAKIQARPMRRNPARRRYQPRARPSQPPPEKQTKALTLKDSNRTTLMPLSFESSRYIEMVANPFSSGHPEWKPSDVICRLPQSCGKDTALFYETGQFSLTIAAASNGAGIFKLDGIDAVGVDASYCYSASTNVPGVASIAGGNAQKYSAQYATLQPILGLAEAKSRIVACGLRCNVNNVNTATVGSGNLVGGHAKFGPLKTAVPAYASASEWNSYCLTGDWRRDVKTLAEGVTVRMPLLDESEAFQTQIADNRVGTSHPFGYLPFVAWWGVSEGVVLNFDWIIYYEAVLPGASTFECKSVIPESNWERIQYYLNNQVPLVTTGHTFRSFMSSVWRGLKSIGRVALPYLNSAIATTKYAPLLPIGNQLANLVL